MTVENKAQSASKVQLRADDLMERARKQTGLSDFGDSWFIEPLKALVYFVNVEGGLQSEDVPPVKHIVNMLSDRLRLADFLKRHPEVHSEKVDLVGFIPGQARGGSTLAQRLVGQSPQLTSTYFWEMFSPVPLKGEQPGNPVERRKIGDAEVASWRTHMPEYAGMHPLSSSYYEEDVWLTDRGFDSYTYTLHFNIPGYYDWMLSQDHTKAFDEVLVWLKLLQSQLPERKGKKWMLKNASHLMTCTLPYMFKVFPNAKCIQIHRAMDESLPSLASVQSVHIRTSGTTTFDRKNMGPHLIHQYLNGLKSMMTLHDQMPDRFIDIRYRDLVADPIGQFRKIITGMGLVCGDADINAAQTWMAANGRGTHPPHNYSPEDFGVTAAQIKETFKFYHDKFLR